MPRSLRLGAILFLAAVLIGGAYTGYCYHRDRTPEAALHQIVRAVLTEDRKLFDEYVDEDAVLTAMHEDVSSLLADNIAALHERHPHDWFFRHDSAFMRDYMADHRTEYIDMARMVLTYYFDAERVPVTKAEGNARWGSDELRAFAAHHSVSMEPAVLSGDRAAIICRVRGDDSDYGRLLPEGSLTMELARQASGHWKLVHIWTDTVRTNGFYAFVDAAERYWKLQGWN
jgi:hypothetical protein